MPLAPDNTAYVSDPILGRLPAQPDAPKPPESSGLDVAAAALRRSHVVGSLYEREQYLHELDAAPVRGYDALDDIAGFEDYAARFFESESPTETQAIKDLIRGELSDLRVLEQAGAKGLISSIAAGVADPFTLASMAVPVAPVVAGAGRGARIAAGVGSQVALDSAAEAALHSMQETRTARESLINVGAGALLTGALGTWVTRIPKTEFERARKTLQEDMDAGGSIGAAKVNSATTLDDEGIAPGGQLLAKTLGRISPLTRILQSSTKEARQLVQRLAEVPYLLNKHLRGVESETAAETQIKRMVHTGRWQARQQLDAAFKEYRQAGGKMSRKEIVQEVSRAMSNGDVTDIPQLRPVISWARQKFKDDADKLRSLGVEIDEGVVGAKSYFPRVYNYDAVIRNRGDLENRLFNWFKNNPKIQEGGAVEPARVDAAMRDGASRSQVNLEIAETDARLASQELDRQKRALGEKANKKKAKAATGARGAAHEAKKTASKAKRAASVDRRTVNRIARRLKAVARRLSDLDTSPPARTEAEIAEEIKTGRLGIADLKSRLSENNKAGRALAAKARTLAAKARASTARATTLHRKRDAALNKTDAESLRKAAKLDQESVRAQQRADDYNAELLQVRAQMEEARRASQLLRDSIEEARGKVTSAQVEGELGRSKLSAFDTLDQRMQRLQKALDERTLKALDSDAAAKQLKQAAKYATDIAKEQKKRVRDATKAARAAAKTARKAQPLPVEDGEIRLAVQDTIDHILGTPSGRADVQIASRSKPLKSRVLDVPDQILEPFLVRDFETVMDGYLRGMSPEIVLREKGLDDEGLKSAMDTIVNKYQVAIDNTESNAVKQQLTKDREQVFRDLEAIVNRLRGNTGPRGHANLHLVRAARVARTYNYVRLLGSQTLSSMSDYGRLIARYGLPRTLQRTGQFLTNWNLNKLSRADAKKFGTAMEWAVDTRSAQIGDIVDELPRTQFEQGMQWVGNNFSRLSLMSTWNSSIKTIATILEQDALAKAVKQSNLSAFKKGQLARMGIGDGERERIAEMVSKHATAEEGITRLRTELWEDKEMAKLVEDAILKVSDEVVVVRGAGDLPVLMDSELAKTLLQFKSFAMASVNRTMIPLAQGLAMKDARTAQGVASMMALGAGVYYAKEFVAGREPSTAPGRLLAESFNWSGMMGPLPDLWDPIAGLHKDLPRFSRYQSRSPTESLFGPTFGTTIDTMYGTLAGMLDGSITQDDLHRLRRLLPGQNLFYLNRLFTAIEGEVGEAAGLEGAREEDFVDRILEEIPSEEAK